MSNLPNSWCADDIVVLARIEGTLKSILTKLVKECKIVGLEINDAKSNYMASSTSEIRRRPRNLSFDNLTLEAFTVSCIPARK